MDTVVAIVAVIFVAVVVVTVVAERLLSTQDLNHEKRG